MGGGGPRHAVRKDRESTGGVRWPGSHGNVTCCAAWGGGVGGLEQRRPTACCRTNAHRCFNGGFLRTLQTRMRGRRPSRSAKSVTAALTASISYHRGTTMSVAHGRCGKPIARRAVAYERKHSSADGKAEQARGNVHPTTRTRCCTRR